jgi:hypothetical protein
MTEQEWTFSANPRAMERFLQHRTSARKARLYACACCRHVWELVLDSRRHLTQEQLAAWTEQDKMEEANSRHAVEVAEAFADGKATEAQLRQAWHEADWAATPYGYDVYNMAVDASNPGLELTGWIATTAANHAPDRSLSPYCDFLRCIYGNPFHELPSLPRAVVFWNDRTVVRLAQVIYDQRRFEDLPILAYALQEAGCDEEEILAHCRGPGPHCRGCWPVDLLLNLS